MKPLAANIALLVILTAVSGRAQEIGYWEDFALAQDRTVPLAQLIPGTEDYYYFHCLHYQNTHQFDKVEPMLKLWVERHKETPRVHEIRNRQALLTYAQDPQESLEYIRGTLGLEFNHQRETIDRKPALPTSLDPIWIDRDRLYKQVLPQHENLQGFEDSALAWLIGRGLDPDRRRDLLSRLARPDHEGLARLVVEDLQHANSGGFGSLGIHGQLLLPQLDECCKLKPDLLYQDAFVTTYLVKLQPSAGVDWRHDAQQHEAYLRRLWDFVQRLAPAHNSLKAHVLYHWLALDRSQGVYDKERFMTYIQLPRQADYISRAYLQREESRGHMADLQQDFSGVTQLPIIGDDQPLVRSYLLHFFLEETTYQPYEAYLDDTYLKQVFAEAKIVNGLGDPQQWYALLSPALYQQLKERVDLDFALTNKTVFGADQPVGLDVYVKNVESLIIKVFEINTRSYYRQYGREVNTDVDLDGLVPNQQQTHTYSEPAMRRTRRHFEFPSLQEPGVYIIDFIGNGQSSRAVVRKGRLHYVVRTSTAGQVFTVLDDAHRKVSDAVLWLAGHEYRAAEDGTIVAPFSNRPGPQPIVLTHGQFSSLHVFQHEAEDYSLAAGIYVDREALLAHRKAKLVLRPGLYLNGTPVTLSVLQDVKLDLRSVDLDGVAAAESIDNVALSEKHESVHEFQVPPRTSQVTVTLSAKLRVLSQNRTVDLTASETFALNEVDRTEKIEDLYLAKIHGAYVLEVLGKTGEPRPDRPVQFSLKHRDFREPVQLSLQSDSDGRITLGPLEEVASVTATSPAAAEHTWSLTDDRHTYPSWRHGVAGTALEVPYMGPEQQPQPDALSLLEMRGETFVADRFDALSLQDGLLRVQGLPVGDYDLLIKRSGTRIRIRLAQGPQREGYAWSDTRHLELRDEHPLQIDGIQAQEDQLLIRLHNATPFTRVHVFATYFQPAFQAFPYLSRVADRQPHSADVAALESLYVQGRDIGDEYRYILDRKQARKFPGNMLPRPHLLLNPWAIRKTETGQQEAAAGEDFGAQAEPQAPAAAARPAESAAPAPAGDFANLDFLREPAATLLNLVPDDEGHIVVPRKDLGSHTMVHVVAVDPQNTVYRSVSLPELPRPVLDLRLAGGLDPAAHFTQRKQISIVRTGEVFQLPDVTSARFETYDSLARVYGLLATLHSDPKWTEFQFLLNWPEMTETDKREKYSKYACHELNFFLCQKDPEFFQHVVLPHLANKMDKTFLDRWLVQDDLRDYLRAWDHAQLNIVERILLAQRIEGQQEISQRHVQDLFHLIPPDAARFNHLFDTALLGSSLQTDSQFAKYGRDLGGVQQALERNGTVQLGEAVGGAAGAPAAPAAAPSEVTARLEVMEEEEQARGVAAGAARKAVDKLATSRGRTGLERELKEQAGQWFFDRNALAEGRVRQLYRQLDKTEEWVENNYYQLPIEQQNAELITVNAFWNDYARHVPGQPFYSIHVAEASRNFSEMMFALAVLDLPWQPKEHQTQLDQPKLAITAASPMIVYHQQVLPASQAETETPILVSQNLFRHDDRYEFKNNQRLDKFVTDEFLVHVVYGCQVVVTNPTSSPRRLDLLLQIPVGPIPVLNSHYTRNVNIDLEPFHTHTLEYHFYFPEPGQYRLYPVHVAMDEQLLAHAEPFTFNVVQQPSRVDRQSWEYVSQYGTDQEVLDFLQQNNLYRIDLDKIAFRMRDKLFFQTVIDLLSRRHVYNHTLWSYGLLHNLAAAIRPYLQHADPFAATCGAYLDSPLLVVDPVVRKTYQHMEYEPLVNARAHQLGSRRQILNDRFHAQYHQLLKTLACRRDLDDEDLMSVTYYMLLQDRVQQALEFFGRVSADRLSTKMQYDYLSAYLDLHTGNLDHARTVAKRYAEYPVPRWHKAFASISSQLDEIAGGATRVADAEDRTQAQTGLTATAPSFDFTIEDATLHIRYQNLDQVEVNCYLMDIELLFSRNPFVQQHVGQFSSIRPNHRQMIQLPPGRSSLAWELPAPLRNQNVLVEISGGGQTKTQSQYSNSMSLQIVETYGQLHVTATGDGKPLPQVYVKVYARMKDGSVRFYKDGYTDLRGRFDYASLSTNQLEFVEKLALLVYSDQHGAVVREVDPPKQ